MRKSQKSLLHEYRPTILTLFVGLLLLELYALFLKGPFLYPGLEKRVVWALFPIATLCFFSYFIPEAHKTKQHLTQTYRQIPTLQNISQTIPWHQVFFIAFVTLSAWVLATQGEQEYTISIILFGICVFSGIATLIYGEGEKEIQKNQSYMQIHTKIALRAITACFLIITILLPITHSGSFIDEYTHIFSGQEILEKGQLPTFSTNQGTYDRGMYVSILVAGAFTIHQSILMAKMVPVLIGILSFFALYLLVRRTINNPVHQIGVLGAYTISPWIIFNHFYIRFYSFYELFLILILLLFSIAISSAQKYKDKQLPWAIAGIIAINFLVWNWSNDLGRYIIILTTGVSSMFLIFTQGDALAKNHKYILPKITRTFLHTSTAKKATVFILIGAILFVALDAPDKISRLRNGELTYTTSDDSKYNTFFLSMNGPITALAIIASTGLLIGWRREKQLIILTGIMLLGVHLFSSPDLQVLRLLLYFLPIFYLLAGIGIESFDGDISPVLTGLIWIIVLFMIFHNTPKGFYTHPEIPGEIHYKDYSKAHLFANTICDGPIYSLIHNPYVGLFYNTPIAGTGYVRESLLHTDTRFEKNEQGHYQTAYGQIPVINGEELKQKIESEEPICIIISPDYANSWRYIEENAFNDIQERFSVQSFIGIDVYYR